MLESNVIRKQVFCTHKWVALIYNRHDDILEIKRFKTLGSMQAALREYSYPYSYRTFELESSTNNKLQSGSYCILGTNISA